MFLDNVFVFDIETVPDVSGARKLYSLASLDDTGVAEYLFSERRQAAETDFIRHHLHCIVAIAIVLKQSNTLKVWSLGDKHSDESELIQRFFKGIDRYKPILVSWNGSGFDLPVLHYRALINGVAAPAYWDVGQHDSQSKWNHYLNRFQFRHTDLMDVLAGYQNRCAAPLEDIATLLGFPGKMGMDGSQIWSSYLKGDSSVIRDYCETDVLNTYLIYLQFEQMRGHLSKADLTDAKTELKEYLRSSPPTQKHWRAFLETWEANSD